MDRSHQAGVDNTITAAGADPAGGVITAAYGVENGIGLTAEELARITSALNEDILVNNVKFRPIPGGRQAAYVPADETL